MINDFTWGREEDDSILGYFPSGEFKDAPKAYKCICPGQQCRHCLLSDAVNRHADSDNPNNTLMYCRRIIYCRAFLPMELWDTVHKKLEAINAGYGKAVASIEHKYNILVFTPASANRYCSCFVNATFWHNHTYIVKSDSDIDLE